jgi:TPR repeat protein
VNNSNDRLPRRLAFAIPALLLLFQTAVAQTEAPPSLSLSPPKSVVVRGTRGPAGDPYNVLAAKGKILSSSRASSCAFIGGNPAATEAMLAYMHDFGLDDSDSFGIGHFSETSPNGDASNTGTSLSLQALSDMAAHGTGMSGCGEADMRFAAGRDHILRKDKSLAQAFAAFDSQDYARAYSLFYTAYKKIGYDEAGLMLAKMNVYGWGTKQDTKEAIRWLNLVAGERFDRANGIRFNPQNPNRMNARIEAIFMLAKAYERGLFGTGKNPAQAKKWYAKAAEYDFVPALNLLGQAWLNGYGGEKSARKALGYFTEAAEKGFVTAQYNLGKLYYTGDDGVPQDLKRAGAWFNVAAKAGYPAAVFAAGRMYDLGEGVPPDQKRAAVYYKEAAIKGDRDAQFALGTYFYEGGVVAKDLATARKLFEVAARQGQRDAMFNLGAMEINGEGGPQDLAMAYVWLSLAKASGHQSAGDAVNAVAPKLTAQEHAKADAILRPKAKG